MGGHVQLGDNIHAQGTGVGHEVLELGLGVVVVLGGQAIIGVLQAVALVSLTDAILILAGLVVVLHEDEVVAQVHMEAVHLVPGHGLGDGLQSLHGGGLTAHVQHEATVLKLGVVTGGTLGDGQVTGQLQGLEHRAGAPVGAGGVVGLDDHLVGDHHVVGLLVEASLIVVHQADVAGLGGVVDDGEGQAEQVLQVGLELLGHGGEGVVGHDAAVGGDGIGQTLLVGSGVPLGQLRHHGGLGVALVGGVDAGDVQLHSGRATGGGVVLVTHSDGDLHGGIHQGGVDGAGGIHHLLIVAAPGGGVLLGHLAGHDHLAVLNLDALGQSLSGVGGGDHDLRLLLVHLKLIHSHVVPVGAAVLLHPNPDIAGLYGGIEVHGLDGSAAGQLALKGLLGGPLLTVHGGLHIPLVGVVALPVENDAAHHVGVAQVVGDGGVLHADVGGPTGALGGLVAVTSLVSGEGGAALHVGGGGDHAVLTGDVGALGELHHIAASILGHVAVHLKLPHTHVVPVGHSLAVLGHTQTHILSGDSLSQLVLGLQSTIGRLHKHLLGPVGAVGGGLDVVGLDVGLFPEHLEAGDGALLAQVQLEPALGGTLSIVVGTPAGGLIIVAIDGGGGGELVGLGVGGSGGDAAQAGQVADDGDHLIVAVHLELTHAHVPPVGHGLAVLGDAQTHIAGHHSVLQLVLHLTGGSSAGDHHLLGPLRAIGGGLNGVVLDVGLLPEYLKAVDGVPGAQVQLEPALGGALAIVVGSPAGGILIVAVNGGRGGELVGLGVGGSGYHAVQAGQIHIVRLGLSCRRCGQTAGEHHSCQQCGQSALQGLLHTLHLFLLVFSCT